MGIGPINDLFDDDWVRDDPRAAGLDRNGLRATVIDSSDHPKFDATYDFLCGYFKVGDDIETRDALVKRFSHNVIPASNTLYLMIVVEHNGNIVAARDHTAILSEDARAIIIHLSHALVAPEWRRSGLGGWLRHWPMGTSLLLQQRLQKELPTTLAAEMSPPHDFDSLTRLAAYEKAGFKKVDPRIVGYLQPDFHDPRDIDAAGGPRPLRFDLIIRRHGVEPPADITGHSLRQLVAALYRMYNLGFRDADMAPNWQHLASYPADDARIPLVPPSLEIEGAAGGHHA